MFPPTSVSASDEDDHAHLLFEDSHSSHDHHPGLDDHENSTFSSVSFTPTRSPLSDLGSRPRSSPHPTSSIYEFSSFTSTSAASLPEDPVERIVKAVREFDMYEVPSDARKHSEVRPKFSDFKPSAELYRAIDEARHTLSDIGSIWSRTLSPHHSNLTGSAVSIPSHRGSTASLVSPQSTPGRAVFDASTS